MNGEAMRLAVAVAAGLLLAAARALGQGHAQPRPQTAEPQRQAPAQEQRGGHRRRFSRSSRPGSRPTRTRCCTATCGGGPELSAARPQPGHDLGADSDGKVRATRRPPRPRARTTASNRAKPPACSHTWRLLRLAQRGLGARRYEQVYIARKVDTATLRASGPVPAPGSDAARAAGGERAIRGGRTEIRADHQGGGVRRPVAAVRSQCAGPQSRHYRRAGCDG